MLQPEAKLATVPLTVAQQRRSVASWKSDWPINLILGLLAFLTYVPLVLTLVNSFKDRQQFFTQFWLPTWPLHLENYQKAWPVILQSILNSLTYSIPTIVLVLAIAALTGFAFARYRFPGREFFFYAILIIIMLPGILLVIPMFRQIVSWGWQNTTQAVFLPWTSVQIPLGMFLMRTFFETLPKEYFEAARIDGASELQLFYKIGLPLAIPALSTLAIFTLLFTWNDLIWPLLAIFDSNKYPVSLGVLAFTTSFESDYGTTFAAYVLASAPLIVVFSFTARRFMAGLQGGVSL